MALEGTIKEFGLADIFQLIGLQKKTGVLFLNGAEGTINIHFEDGMVVKVENSRMSQKYLSGNIFLNRGIVNESQLKEALEIQKSTGQKLGQVLIGQGIMSKDELRDVLTHQMCENIYSAFRWHGGDYKFYQDKVDYDRNVIAPINFENILMDGVRLMDEWPRIEKRMPSRDAVLKRSPGRQGLEEDAEKGEEDIFAAPEVKADHKGGLTKEASTIFKMVDGRSTVFEIIENSSLGEFETCKAIVELVEKDYVVKTGDRPQILVEQPKPVETVKEPLNLSLVPYALMALALLLVFLQVTGTRKITDSDSAGLEALKTPFTLNQVKRVYNNSVLYYFDFGTYPESADILTQLDYVSGSDIIDPWGSKIRTELYQNGLRVVSAGPDRTMDTADDIRNYP